MLEKDTAILAEIRDAIAEVKNDGSAKSENLLTEQPDKFSTDAMSFNNITAMIMEQAEDLFAVTRCIDRSSRQYLKLCKTLEKTVDHLGSSCITKEAMIQKKYDVSGMETLSTFRLNEMITFNFRKCNAALNEAKLLRHEFDENLLLQMLSFANTMGRLRATESRVHEVERWYKDPQKFIKGVFSFTDKNGNPKKDEKISSPVPFRESPSYAIRYDVLEEAARVEDQGARVEDQGARGKEQGVRDQENFNFGEAPVVGSADAAMPAQQNCTPRNAPETLGSSPEVIEAEIIDVPDSAVDHANENRNYSPEETALEDKEQSKGMNSSDNTGIERVGPDGIVSKQAYGRPDLSTNPAVYYAIMRMAMDRSREAGEDTISFTIEEMQILLSNQYFCMKEKELAKAFRSCLAPLDSG